MKLWKSCGITLGNTVNFRTVTIYVMPTTFDSTNMTIVSTYICKFHGMLCPQTSWYTVDHLLLFFSSVWFAGDLNKLSRLEICRNIWCRLMFAHFMWVTKNALTAFSLLHLDIDVYFYCQLPVDLFFLYEACSLCCYISKLSGNSVM